MLRERQERLDQWQEKIENCSDREDFEYLYSHKNQWQQFATDSGEEFKEVLSSLAFKKEWSDADLEEATQSLRGLELK